MPKGFFLQLHLRSSVVRHHTLLPQCTLQQRASICNKVKLAA